MVTRSWKSADLDFHSNYEQIEGSIAAAWCICVVISFQCHGDNVFVMISGCVYGWLNLHQQQRNPSAWSRVNWKLKPT
jgi:hypothetical protein